MNIERYVEAICTERKVENLRSWEAAKFVSIKTYEQLGDPSFRQPNQPVNYQLPDINYELQLARRRPARIRNS